MSIQLPAAPSVDRVVAEIDKFLAPAIKERDSTKSISTRLAAVQDDADVSVERRQYLLQEASRLLLSINEAVIFDQSSHGLKKAYDSRLLGVVYNLLDVLVLEGIYPSLPSGVGNLAERRTKSLLWRKPDPSYVSPTPGDGLIDYALLSLDSFIATPDSGIENIIRHRLLADLIAGNSWISHSKGLSNLPPNFEKYLSRLPIPTLYLALTGLNKPSTPAWFRTMLTRHLSLLPLRPNGVRHTIEFIASSYPARPAPASDDNPKLSKGAALPLEGLQQASRLLSSIPESMATDEYLTRLAPQLLDLLDQADEKELSRAAAFVIGSGILGKRALGAPGTIGWKLFVEQDHQALNPSANPTTKNRKIESESLEKELVSTTALTLALKRLSILTTSHPNPGLTGRLIRPILLPLWALMNSAENPTIATAECSELAFGLLQTFFRLFGSLKDVDYLSTNLLFDGSPQWKFGPGSSGGISIRERESRKGTNVNIIDAIPRIDFRVNQFVRLLSSGAVDEQVISSLFLNLSRQWLIPQREQGKQQLQFEADPLQNLMQAKLAQAVLEKFQDKISQNPDQILHLIAQILGQQLESIKAETTRKRNLKTATYSSLTNLVSPTEELGRTSDDPNEMLAVAVSLLNAILTSTNFTSNKATLIVLDDIRSTLSSLAKDPNSVLSASLTLSIQSSLSLLRNGPKPGSSRHNTPAFQTDIHETLNMITTDLSSSLPPIRTSALHALESLVKMPEEPLDVPTIALLLLSTVRNETEEYVFLAAIKVLVQLALRRDLTFVTKLVSEAFMDIQEETGVDGRLRVGQTLSLLVDGMTEEDDALHSVARSKVLAGVAEACITVSSRRGSRRKEEQERKAAVRLEKRKKREAEKAFGGEIPNLPSEEEDSDGEVLSPVKKQRRKLEREAISKIVQGWTETGLEEDIRIRTSALSILSSILSASETLSLFPNGVIDNATQSCLAILTLETSPSSAILRRAAVMVLLSLLNSTDAAFQERSMAMSPEKWAEIEKVLKFVADTDLDDLVLSHAKDFLESLEAWNMKRIQVVTQAPEGGQIRFGLEGKLRGLEVNPDVEETKGRMMIEEME
ncbi:Armadillo-like helical [Venturia nashicola]|uniref:Armadillo-like helical n=1 Tax=Venturia nashicola TaxID=86259 RepID=A0A4Z1PI68_9PEZI|nr:Armadillo-like helical [Venturia nashicola]